MRTTERLAASRRDLSLFAVVICWIAAVLSLDTLADANQEHLLGLGTWLLLIGCLWRESPRSRLQVAVVVCFATVVEYTFSGVLHVYVYRLHDIPWFVPPGHGLVYLAALALGRSPVFVAHRRFVLAAVAVLGASYAGWGLFASGRLDVLGAIWFGCLLGFIAFGRAPLVYAAAFLVVSYLELLGTHLGVWTWSRYDPTGLIAMGNPPSGAAGGYCFFDAAAMALTPRLLSWAQRWAQRSPQRSPQRPAGRHRPSSICSTAGCSSALLATALPPSARAWPDRSVNLPPASSTIT